MNKEIINKVKLVRALLDKNNIKYEVIDEDDENVLTKFDFNINFKELTLEVRVVIGVVFIAGLFKVPVAPNEEKVNDLVFLINYINTRMPMGSFEYDVGVNKIYFRSYVAGDGEGLNLNIMQHLLDYPMYAIFEFYKYLSGLNSNLITLDEVLKKIEAEEE